jgi:CRP-like cAMP-binding protein
MEDISKLKSIILFSHLSDEMIVKIAAVTELINFTAKEYIFRQGQPAEYLYSVYEGKVQLEIDIDSDNPIQLQGIMKSFTFGISSLIQMDDNCYSQSAKAIIDSQVFKWKASDLIRLFEEDYKLGYLFMRRISKILKTRFSAKDALIDDFYRYVRSFGKR